MVSFSPIPAPGTAPESADGTLAGGAFGRVPGGSAITRGTAKRIIDRIHRDVRNAAAHPGIGDAHPLAAGREAAAAERAALGSDELRAREAELSEAITELTREKNRAEAKRAKVIAELREVARERFLRENQEIDPNSGPLSTGENEVLHTQLAEEIALAVTAGRPTGTALLADAMTVTVTEDLPRVWAAYEAGVLDQRRVHLIGQATGGATPQAKRILDAQLAELAPTLTPGTLARVARALRDRVDPVSPEARHASAFERRAVWLDPRGDGMADLTIHAAAPELAAILDRAQTLAKHLADEEKAEHAEWVAEIKRVHPDEAPDALEAALDALPQPRGIGQLRADVMVELLLSGETDGTDTSALWGRVSPTAPKPAPEFPEGYPRDKDGPLPPWSLTREQRAEWFTEEGLPPDGAEPEPELLTPVSLRPRTSPPPGIRGSVNITVPARLLAGIRHDLDPGDTDDQILAKEFALLNGVTVLDDESALRIASGLGNLRNLYIDDEGALLDVGRNSYAPPVSLRRFAELRDRHCRFPGCEQPATNCDLDHSVPWQHGGHTKQDNLAHLCRSHHTMKSRGDEQGTGANRHRGWRLVSNESGTLIWETLSGRRVTTRPERATAPRGS